MQIEDFLEFSLIPAESIRIKGTRINLESVVELHRLHMTPEQIAVHFGSPLKLEQVYAAILYYRVHQAEVDAYIQRGEHEHAQRLQMAQSSPAALRIRAMKAGAMTHSGVS